MLRKVKSPLVAATLVLSTSLFYGCADDEEVPDPVNEVTPEEEPAAPPAIDEPPPPTDGLEGASFNAEVIYFAYDDYTLSPEAQNNLSGLADFMKSNEGSLVQIEGHCDERGSIEYNLALGERRAQSVKSYLVQLGVDPSRLTTISYGEEKAAVEGHNEEAWSQNRRAEFILSGQ